VSRTLHVANTNAILDPEYAVSEAAKFKAQIEVATLIRSYASNLLVRSYVTSPKQVPDLMVIALLFHQALSAYDAWLLCLENGAVDASNLHARSLWEASLYLDWILSNGKERWARQLYVSSIREELQWVRRSIKGTLENEIFKSAWTDAFHVEWTALNDQQNYLINRERELLRLLSSKTYEKINSDFELVSRRGKPEPDWYRPGEGSPKSLYDMAKRLGRSAEYTTLYKIYSSYSHGTRADNHFKVRNDSVVIEPVRRLARFRDAFIAPTYTMIGILQSVIEEYRPGEAASFASQYAKWKPALQVPKVVVTETYLAV
jgi:hypothetical protein